MTRFEQLGRIEGFDDAKVTGSAIVSDGEPSWVIDSSSDDVVAVATDPAGVQGTVVAISAREGASTIVRKLQAPSGTSLIYSILVFDDPANTSARFGLYAKSGKDLLWVGVDGGSTFEVHTRLARFDTGIVRSCGWTALEIVVTEAGTYSVLRPPAASCGGVSEDRQALVYMGSPGPPTEDALFPINTSMTSFGSSAAELGFEVPAQASPPSTVLIDDFAVYAYGSPPSLLRMQEQLILDFLGRYETQMSLITAQEDSALSAHAGYVLSVLALAAGFGVRAIQSAGSERENAWTSLNRILESVARHYPLWIADVWSSPIPAQAFVQVAAFADAEGELAPGLREMAVAIAAVDGQRAATMASELDRGIIRPANDCSYDGDSRAEEMAWYASSAGFAAGYVPVFAFSQAMPWNDAAAVLARHAVMTTPEDGCDRPALQSDGCVENHHIPDNASYTLTVPLEFAQAVLYPWSRGKTIPPDFRAAMDAINGCLHAHVRGDWFAGPHNWTYESDVPGNVIYSTGRDDWEQDATLQDQGWAFVDAALNTSILPKVIKYAWLTRAGGTLYTHRLAGEVDVPFRAYPHDPEKYFYLSAMDAFDRFVTLFVPGLYGTTGIPRYRLASVTSRTAVLPDSTLEEIEGDTMEPPWELESSGEDAAVAFEPLPAPDGGRVLAIQIGDGSLRLSRQVDVTLANVVYQVELQTDPTAAEAGCGARFWAVDNAGHSLSVATGDAVAPDTFVAFRDDGSTVDTGVARLTDGNAWHLLQIFVTEAGAYVAVDGVSVLSARSPEYPYTPLRRATAIGLEVSGCSSPHTTRWTRLVADRVP